MIHRSIYDEFEDWQDGKEEEEDYVEEVKVTLQHRLRLSLNSRHSICSISDLPEEERFSRTAG